jgi:hypothetical protein
VGGAPSRPGGGVAGPSATAEERAGSPQPNPLPQAGEGGIYFFSGSNFIATPFMQ